MITPAGQPGTCPSGLVAASHHRGGGLMTGLVPGHCSQHEIDLARTGGFRTRDCQAVVLACHSQNLSASHQHLVPECHSSHCGIDRYLCYQRRERCVSCTRNLRGTSKPSLSLVGD